MTTHYVIERYNSRSQAWSMFATRDTITEAQEVIDRASRYDGVFRIVRVTREVVPGLRGETHPAPITWHNEPFKARYVLARDQSTKHAVVMDLEAGKDLLADPDKGGETP